MNRFIFLVVVFLFACSKDKSSKSGTFQKLQGRMWKMDSIVQFLDNGRRDVYVPATMNSQYVKFTSSQIEYYSSSNLDAPVLLESDAAVYKRPNILEAWFPGRTSGPPSYKIEVDSVNDTWLRYYFLNTPDYARSRAYYYHAY